MTDVTVTPENKLTPKMQAFQDRIAQLQNSAGPADTDAVTQLAAADQPIGIREVTPTVAAMVFDRHNGHNRDFQYSKAEYYAKAMERGEWKVNHQGIAFYPDGNLADGQHRLAAVAMSGHSQRFVVMPSFGEDAFDTIDVGKLRSAGDALQLRGIENGPAKANIARTVMRYEHQVKTGRPLQPTVIETELFVDENDALLTTVLDVGTRVINGTTDPCLSANETASTALLMLRGGYPESTVTGYLSAINVGVADSESQPTFVLNRTFAAAKVSEKKAYKLSKTHKLAMMLKAAPMHVLHKAVPTKNALKWNPQKEPLPAPTPPIVSEAAE